MASAGSVRVGRRRFKRFQYEERFEESVLTYTHVTHHRKQKSDWRERNPPALLEKGATPTPTPGGRASASKGGTEDSGRARSARALAKAPPEDEDPQPAMKYTSSCTGQMMARALLLEREMENTDHKHRLRTNYAATQGYNAVLRVSRELMEEREHRILARLEQEEFERMIVATNQSKRDLVEQQVSDAMDGEFTKMKSTIKDDMKATIDEWKTLKAREAARARRKASKLRPPATSRSSSASSDGQESKGRGGGRRRKAARPGSRLLPLPTSVKDVPAFESDCAWVGSPTQVEGCQKQFRKLNPLRHAVHCIKAYARPQPRTTHLLQMATVLPPLYSPKPAPRSASRVRVQQPGPAPSDPADPTDTDSVLGDGYDPAVHRRAAPHGALGDDAGAARSGSHATTPAVSCGELMAHAVGTPGAAPAGPPTEDVAVRRIQGAARVWAARREVRARRAARDAAEREEQEQERRYHEHAGLALPSSLPWRQQQA
eukprot:TRINITY_DN3372_c0_g1_i1.p1 TRINITY_DN3372_c0_g1~~TRINITY_DN3372_c0_g1_i1.p1  ORF type:complete len:489 (+),score=164.59 TRINITY_DN3372_c0_g1_i1:62-1528(+)